MNKTTYWEQEDACLARYEMLGPVYHCCTPEDHPILFTTKMDFEVAMSIFGICAALFPGLRILTFEIMNNHMHIVVVGEEAMVREMFDRFRKYLARYFRSISSLVSLRDFKLKTIQAESLENLRNVIAYVNRNGAKVDPDTTPMSYPWGANRCFFSPDARKRYFEQRQPSGVLWRRNICHSRCAGEARKACLVDGYVDPFSFCDISLAENLFRNARHYFSKVSRHIEVYDDIARMIGEQVSYTDNDLYSAILQLCRKEYDVVSPALLSKEDKISLAKRMHQDYNAGNKQISRMLNLQLEVLNDLF